MHVMTLIVGKGRDRPRPAEWVVSSCGAVPYNSYLRHQAFSMCRDDCTDEVISVDHSSEERTHLSWRALSRAAQCVSRETSPLSGPLASPMLHEVLSRTSSPPRRMKAPC